MFEEEKMQLMFEEEKINVWKRRDNSLRVFTIFEIEKMQLMF